MDLISNHMLGLGDFLDKTISKFSEMYLGNLSQISPQNIWLLVLIDHCKVLTIFQSMLNQVQSSQSNFGR